MSIKKQAYKIGDHVVHWAHGPGVVVELDEKELAGKKTQYYVVEANDLTLWIPTTTQGESSLRPLSTPSKLLEVLELFAIQGEPLAEDRHERKLQLADQMKNGTLESVCKVIRDLTHHNRTQKKNENDNAILTRAVNLLVEEWSQVLSMPVQEVERSLEKMLAKNENGSKE